MSTTPNMNLTLPDVGTTPGPEWANELVTALEDVDLHDHSVGSGVRITPAGLNINDALSMQSNDIISTRSLKLDDQSVALTGEVRSVYAKGGELIFMDGAGNEVAITAAGGVAGTPGSIADLVSPASASYSSITHKFSFFDDTNEYGKFAISDLELYEFGVASPNPITIKSPASVGSAYSITLPGAVPSKTAPTLMSGSGVLSTITLDDGQLLVGATAGAPAAANITGTANQITVTNGANAIGLSLTSDVTITGLLLGNGSVSTPALRFSGDTNTGIYSGASDNLNFATNGTQRMVIGSSSILSTLQYRSADGSASAPVYSFSSDTNTGVYAVSADVLGFAVGGSGVASVTSGGFQATGDITASDDLIAGDTVFASNGAAGSPAFSFTSDTDMGVYKNGTNLCLAADSNSELRIGNNGMTLDNGTETLFISPGDTAATAGSFVEFMLIQINGVTRKIQLFANS